MSMGIWLISFVSQVILLLPQIMFKPTWISQGIQGILRALMDDPSDTTKSYLKSALSHAKYSIRHPHPPLTRDVQILIITSAIVFCWSLYRPYDRFEWYLEIAPVVVGIMSLAGIFYRLPFTKLFYWLFFTLMIFGMIGAHYTYEKVPVGEWMQHAFYFERNHFDRMTHFIQGLVTFIFAREILFRLSPIRKGKWLTIFSVCLVLVTAHFYEMIEWTIASWTDEPTQSFDRATSNLWDTQWDMVWSLLGSIMSMMILIPMHQKQLARLTRYLHNLPPKKKRELIR